MSFIAFKVSDYEHTAEREQYRTICNLLRKKYEKCDDLCLFIANYNIFDCELDGVVIKSDAIIGIEFKNYGGNITAVENGHWKLSDGTFIKGGSNKTVYQQAKLNHIAIKRGLKEGNILPSKMLANIPTLIVFNKPIILQNNLGERTQSWLHICDTNHFIDKIEDITTPKFYLSNDQILELIPKLGLIDEFVDSRFTVDVSIHPMSKDVESDNSTDTAENDSITPIDSSLAESQTSDYGSHSISRGIASPQSTLIPENEDIVKKGYYDFIHSQIIPAIGLTEDYNLLVVHYDNYEQILNFPLPFKSEYVAIIQASNIASNAARLSRIFKKEVVSLSNDIIAWGEGDFEFKPTPQLSSNKPKEQSKIGQYNKMPQSISESIILPQWIDDLIYNSLGAKYQPSYERYAYNLDLNKDESKIYLGTYFPRSFAESFLVFSTILNAPIFKSIVDSKRVLNILDFGCGSGGEIFGFLHSLESNFNNSINIKVVGVDGNHNSLRIFEKIVAEYNKRKKNLVELIPAPCFIENQSDFLDISELIGNNLDFIITSKAIGEFERKNRLNVNGYEFFCSLFAPLLSNTGIMSIIDVTTKAEHSDLYLSQLLNVGVNAFIAKNAQEFKSIVPCSGLIEGYQCGRECFFKKEINVSHSAKSKDFSKFAVRVISRHGLEIDSSHFSSVFSNPNCLNT